MKKVNWIIEKDLFDQYENKLVNSIKNSGMNYLLYDVSSNINEINRSIDYFNNRYGIDDVTIFHGSLQLGRRILKTGLFPGIFLTLENYECYNYYGYFGDYLLNSTYFLMGINDVVRNRNKIFNYFNTNEIFIRPSNGYKTFTGQTIKKHNFDNNFEILVNSYGGVDMDTLVLLSPTKENDIEEEYRFVVIDGKVITGNLYLDKESRKEWEPYYDRVCDDKKAFLFAEKMAKLYQPDLAYTIDICRIKNGDYKIIELNSFCCACLYGGEIDKIVKATNELCLKEYYDVYE